MVAQRVRVFFSDPDATDSDDSTDDSNSMHAKAVTKEQMIIPFTACTNNPTHASSTIVQSASAPPPPPPPPRMRGAKVARSAPSRRFRGVYERQPGRWVADFRSHRLKVRRWIGTFPSEEEAKAAYDAFRAQLSLGASVEAARQSPTHWAVPAATATRSVVPDEPDQSDEPRSLSVLSSSSPPGMSSSTSSPPTAAAAVASHSMLPYDDDERQMEDPFFAEVISHDDLAGLPLPPLDDKLDFGSGEWSLLDIDAPVPFRNECNLGP